EHIPRIARTAHRFALLRSVAHPDNTHTVAMHYMLTGRRHAQPNTNPRNRPDDFPCFGAIARYLQGNRAGLPAGISLNAPANQVAAANPIFPGFCAGILGNTYDPLFIAADPSKPGFQPFPVPVGADAGRLRQRRGLLAGLDARRRSIDEVATVR